ARSEQREGPYDVALVEGSITTPHDVERIKEIRSQSRYLVTLGACATAGGIQALRNWSQIDEFVRHVYARPEYIQTLATSTPIGSRVTVDFELRGCPIRREQLLEVLSCLVRGRKPRLPNYSVCMECKRKGTVCVAVAQGTACLGPVTQAGCGALCPAFGRECFGCFGPKEHPQLASLHAHYLAQGIDRGQLVRLTRSFNGFAPEFSDASDALEQQS
ncbi:MAG: oxidoreductase, partial [Pirellulaceae bacterium]